MTSIASFRERFTDFRSCWVVFIHVVWGCPGGLQFSKGEAVKICLASDSSDTQTELTMILSAVTDVRVIGGRSRSVPVHFGTYHFGSKKYVFGTT